jgi:hypothetical protein
MGRIDALNGGCADISALAPLRIDDARLSKADIAGPPRRAAGPRSFNLRPPSARRFRARHVRAIGRPIQPDIAHPAPEHPLVLPRADVRRTANAAREQVVLGLETGLDNPCLYRSACRWRDLELHRLPGLALRDDRARRNLSAMLDVAHLQRDQVAAAQLAVDAQIEQRQLARAALLLHARTNRPYVLRLERCLLPDELALVSGHALSSSGLVGLHGGSPSTRRRGGGGAPAAPTKVPDVHHLHLSIQRQLRCEEFACGHERQSQIATRSYALAGRRGWLVEWIARRPLAAAGLFPWQVRLQRCFSAACAAAAALIMEACRIPIRGF